MTNKIEELKKDILELESLENQATRQKVKDILSIEKRKLVSEVIKLEEQEKVSSSNAPIKTFSGSTPSNRYQVKLNNYAWDQTSKFVKFYITLKNVQNIPAENVKCNFTPKSLELTVQNLDNKDYVLNINNLLHHTSPEESSWKVKTDMIVLNVAKKDQTNWSHVTELEKKASEAQTPKYDADNMDPGEGIMSLMKNMYERGDDEMKRTIAKAWTESKMKGPAF